MPFERLSESTQTLYAELRELAIHAEAEAAAAAVPVGTFVSKTIKGGIYWYLQQVAGEARRQVYLGRESPALSAWIEGVRTARERTSADAADRARLVRMLTAGGAATEGAAVVKVLGLLAEAGVFRRGGVLVGTQAFILLGNLLGVRFDRQSLRTQDVDIAQDRAIGIALAEGDDPANVGESLAGAGLGFSAVPGLDPRQPSTSYKVRGRELRVDFLTPLIGRETGNPVFLPSLGVSAQPLRLLEYLLDDTVQAVVVGGDGVLVNVPDPARYALHKLWLAGRRHVGEQTKAAKDLRQSEALLEVLLEDRPADLPVAWEALARRVSAAKAFRNGLRRLAPEVREALRDMVGEIS